MSTEIEAANDDVRIWSEGLSNPQDPCLLLVMAAYWQAISWPDEFCTELQRAGFYVIRYDHRDTGRSSVVNYDEAPYTLADLADDAAAVLDAHGIREAHLMGGSMGGMVAQEFALRHPERALSLVSYASTPLAASYAAATSEELPGPDETAWAAFGTVAGPGKQPTRDEYAGGWVDFSRGVNGSATPFDEAGSRDVHFRREPIRSV